MIHMTDTKTTHLIPRGLICSSTLMGLLLLTACSSTPPPTLAVQSAEQAISAAEQARVADYASPELSEARDKLAASHVAIQQDEMVLAQRLADEARADAQLATAKADAARAQVVNDDMQKSNVTLKQEMQRNTEGQQ
jgi:hypothetical protein